jgi:hypothetical protein
MNSLFTVGLNIFRDLLSLDLQHLLIAEARELVPRDLLEVDVDRLIFVSARIQSLQFRLVAGCVSLRRIRCW